jgi:hypothetical protein
VLRVLIGPEVRQHAARAVLGEDSAGDLAHDGEELRQDRL